MLPSPKNLLTSYMPRRPESGSDTGGGWFDLDDWIGPQHPSGRSDVAKIEGILANSGDYSLERTQGPTGYWGLALDDGIRKYQKRNGLKIDGTLRPGGPTIEHMRANFSALLDGHTPPTPDDIDAHHEVVNDDNPGTIAWQDPPATFANVANLPEVDQETDASNARLARGMAKSGDFRSYAQLFARTIQDSGLSGVAAVNDAIQKFDAIHPGKGGLLASAVQSEVPEETLKAFGPRQAGSPAEGDGAGGGTVPRSAENYRSTASTAADPVSSAAGLHARGARQAIAAGRKASNAEPYRQSGTAEAGAIEPGEGYSACRCRAGHDARQ